MNRGAIKQEFYRLSNEVSSSPILQVATGTGGAPTATTDQALNLYADEAMDWLATHCIPLLGEATLTTVAGQRVYNVWNATLTAPDPATLARDLWDVYSVSLGADRLPIVTEGSLMQEYSDYESRANSATPQFAYRPARGRIGLFAPPTVGLLPKLFGYCLPLKLVDDAATPVWLNEDDHRLIPLYCLIRAAKKRIDDPALSQRIAPYTREFVALCTAHHNTIEAARRVAYFPLTPARALSISMEAPAPEQQQAA